RRGPAVQKAGQWAAGHWGVVVDLLRLALRAAALAPKPLLAALTGAARKALPKEWVPLAGADLPGPGPRRRGDVTLGSGGGQVRGPGPAGVAAVYFATCVNSLFAPVSGGIGVGAALGQLCRLAGVRLAVPDGIGGLCCGTVWTSKGLTDGAAKMATAVFDALWRATAGGELAVVADAASCTHGLQSLREHLDARRAEQAGALRVVDAVSFVRRELSPRLRVDRRLGAVAVHPTCSTVHIGAKDDLVALAGLVGAEVFVPLAWGCCAFAGDRGMLHPELTAAATRPEADAVWAAEDARARAGGGDGRFDAYVSANRTCELGIGRATGRAYRHVLEALAPLARPA
ncbi:MAG: (Fe-S)-binding protein, partial [Bifidobacteriaceae bacterium]|nr:(Fe-S)-binding protein [Bifidobacteriaceae bacterium]